MIFANLRFAELARMLMSMMTKTAQYFQWTLMIKKKSKLQLVRVWKLLDEVATICPYRAIEKLIIVRNSYFKTPPEQRWTDPRLLPIRPATARDIPAGVSWCLERAKLPRNHLYLLKKAMEEFLQAAEASATQITRFFQHSVLFLHGKQYRANDLGQQTTLCIYRLYKQRSEAMRVCICS
jgi:hypothetical protein